MVREVDYIYEKLNEIHKEAKENIWDKPYEILNECDFEDLPNALMTLNRKIEGIVDSLDELINDIKYGEYC